MAAAVSHRGVAAPAWTTAPGGARWIALYDGHCRFCTRQAKQLETLVGAKRVELLSFQDGEPAQASVLSTPGGGALARFPGITHEACMRGLHVVRPDGRVFARAEAVARAMTLLPVVGWLAFLYYLPGVRQLAEAAYRVVARNRYRIAGRTGECDGGTCSLHQ